VVLFCLFVQAEGFANNDGVEMRLLISNSQKTAIFLSDKRLIIRSYPSGKRIRMAKISKATIFKKLHGFSINGKAIKIKALRIDSSNKVINYQGKKYAGYFVLHQSDKNSIEVINHLGLESYLKGVLPSEMPSKWPIESLKAQSVAARTYALYRRAERVKERYHLTGTTTDQVYTGLEKGNKKTDKAVDETRGMILTYKNKLIKTYYHSTSGMRTESVSEVFSKTSIPYLKSVSCPYDKGSPHYRWTLRLRYREIEKAFNKTKRKLGKIKSIVATSYTRSGRVRYLKIKTAKGNIKIKGTEFRMVMGAGKVKSTLFRLSNRKGAVNLRGSGYGHGVGLCQWGARGMALRGWDFKAILSHYYPGTRIQPALPLLMGR